MDILGSKLQAGCFDNFYNAANVSTLDWIFLIN